MNSTRPSPDSGGERGISTILILSAGKVAGTLFSVTNDVGHAEQCACYFRDGLWEATGLVREAPSDPCPASRKFRPRDPFSVAGPAPDPACQVRSWDRFWPALR